MTDRITLKAGTRRTIAALAGAMLLSSGVAVSAAPQKNASLAGTWTLVAADREYRTASGCATNMAIIPRAG